MAANILIVDDNEGARSINRARLETGGFSVAEAGNGVECLKRLEEGIPDLIILDLVMPVMDGYKVLQMIKTNPKTRDIPVIVLSGRGQPEEVDKALKLGAADYLVKLRTNPNLLLEKVKESFKKKEGGPAVQHYLLSIKEKIHDAVRMSQDFNLPLDYHCQKCGNALLLELVPDFSHDEPWFTGHFVCTVCRKGDQKTEAGS